MDVLAGSATASSSYPRLLISNFYKNHCSSASMAAAPPPQLLQWKYLPVRIVEARAKSPLMCIMTMSLKRPINYANYSKIKKKLRLKKYAGSLHEVIKCSEKIRRHIFVFVAGLMVVMSASLSVSSTPSWALTEENLLFLEAWKMIDRAYVDKSFNGQSWFRYRENALRNEPMNAREETCFQDLLILACQSLPSLDKPLFYSAILVLYKNEQKLHASWISSFNTIHIFPVSSFCLSKS